MDVLRTALEGGADPERAEHMARYMKGHFEFLGLSTPDRRKQASPLKAAAKSSDGDEIVAFVHRCWKQPEREFQYVGSDLLAWNVAKLAPRHLADLEHFVSTNSWWDTVDSLASWTVGGLVAANQELVGVMDVWVESENMWIARAAILHQLRYKDSTDVERLFRYALRRAGDTEFFIRKAIGWSLRQYAHTDPEEIRTFMAEHGDRFSGLTRREALKNIG